MEDTRHIDLFINLNPSHRAPVGIARRLAWLYDLLEPSDTDCMRNKCGHNWSQINLLQMCVSNRGAVEQ
jgi:hypothetical protein